MHEATVIFPHQLFEQHPAVCLGRPVYLVEEPHFFTRYRFHKQKLQFHKATLLEYYEFLKGKGYKVEYVTLEQSLFEKLSSEGIKHLHIALLYDKILEEAVLSNCLRNTLSTSFYESPYFITSMLRFEELFAEKESFYFSSFYQSQRRYFSILMTEQGKPIGGKYSFDVENRRRFDPSLSFPPRIVLPIRDSMEVANNWVKRFQDNPGTDDIVNYPVTFDGAKEWLQLFLEERLANFGAYEDALSDKHAELYHSVLSPLINVGLLTPDYVVKQTLFYSKKNDVPLNSLEGFIRQIIGWREFVYGVYLYKGSQQQQSNYFNHQHKLPQAFWTGTTGIGPIDVLLRRILKTAYAHHIERLMVLGNFMLLCGIHPNEVYRWFMEFFIDSYDWVMIPNIFGMSQYADGGIMTTKPYIAGAHYLKKMSNYPSGAWEKIYTDLYWNFVSEQRDKLLMSNRMSYLRMSFNSLDPQKVSGHRRGAQDFLRLFLS